MCARHGKAETEHETEYKKGKNMGERRREEEEERREGRRGEKGKREGEKGTSLLRPSPDLSALRNYERKDGIEELWL